MTSRSRCPRVKEKRFELVPILPMPLDPMKITQRGVDSEVVLNAKDF